MKKKYEAPSVDAVLFQPKEALMNDPELDEELGEGDQSGEDW